MAPFLPLPIYTFGDLFSTCPPDFAFAFTFFTSLMYAVLQRRFGAQGHGVTMSAAQRAHNRGTSKRDTLVSHLADGWLVPRSHRPNVPGSIPRRLASLVWLSP